MDASIMNGTNLDAGSVVCVQNITNPIRVARAIMEQVSGGGGGAVELLTLRSSQLVVPLKQRTII